VLGGLTEKLIEKNTTIPTKSSKVFTTAADFQTAVTVHVVQGERPMAEDNVSLGMFNLGGIPPAPRGVPQIEVTFDIDANGILKVAAKDLGTGKENRITITASTKLSKEEKERLSREAETYAEQDRKKREEAELRNEADSMIYTAETTKKQLAGRLAKPEEEKIDNAIGALKGVLDGKDTGRIRSALEELRRVLQAAGASVYQQAQSKTASASSTENRDGSKVTDADYKVVEGDK
jgi:molecular chaperone DnaK